MTTDLGYIRVPGHRTTREQRPFDDKRLVCIFDDDPIAAELDRRPLSTNARMFMGTVNKLSLLRVADGLSIKAEPDRGGTVCVRARLSAFNIKHELSRPYSDVDLSFGFVRMQLEELLTASLATGTMLGDSWPWAPKGAGERDGKAKSR